MKKAGLMFILAACGPTQSSAPIAAADASDSAEITADRMSTDRRQMDHGQYVYVMTNAEDNAVQAYRINADGPHLAGQYRTAGRGSHGLEIPELADKGGVDSLGSQGALRASDDHRFLFAVNTVSATITAFFVRHDGSLQRTDVRSTGAPFPNSVAQRGNLLYVTNVGNGTAHASVSAFFFDGTSGKLYPMQTPRALSTGAAGPSSIVISPDGAFVAVSEKAANAISVFAVENDGTLAPAVVTPSAGQTPFGSQFVDASTLIVTEAQGGAPGAASASTYNLASDGTLSALTTSVGDTQTAACWLSLSGNLQYAYVSNTGSDSISTLHVEANGTATLETAQTVIGAPKSAPTDSAVSRDGRMFFVLFDGAGSVGSFLVTRDGGLTAAGIVTGVPHGAQGLIAL